MKPSLLKGQLTTWKDERGFGFIQPVGGGPDVFLHISEIKDASRRPIVGDVIYYRLAEQNGKVCASSAFILGARRKPMESAPRLRNKAAVSIQPLYPFPVLEAVALSTFPVISASHFWGSTGNPLPLVLYGVMGLISFWLYATDKMRAQQKAWRISEKTLILCDLACGWIGGFVAQRRFNHKVSKTSYQLGFWLVVAAHYAAWLGFLIVPG